MMQCEEMELPFPAYDYLATCLGGLQQSQSSSARTSKTLAYIPEDRHAFDGNSEEAMHMSAIIIFKTPNFLEISVWSACLVFSAPFVTGDAKLRDLRSLPSLASNPVCM